MLPSATENHLRACDEEPSYGCCCRSRWSMPTRWASAQSVMRRPQKEDTSYVDEQLCLHMQERQRLRDLCLHSTCYAMCACARHAHACGSASPRELRLCRLGRQSVMANKITQNPTSHEPIAMLPKPLTGPSRTVRMRNPGRALLPLLTGSPEHRQRNSERT